MSELTPCNYCNLEAIKFHAKKKNKKVEIVASKDFPGWTDVLVNGRFVSTFMELPDHCCCEEATWL